MSFLSQALLALTLSGYAENNQRLLLILREKKKEKGSTVVKLKLSTEKNFQAVEENGIFHIQQLKLDDTDSEHIYDCKYYCEMGKGDENIFSYWGNCN